MNTKPEQEKAIKDLDGLFRRLQLLIVLIRYDRRNVDNEPLIRRVTLETERYVQELSELIEAFTGEKYEW